MFAYDIWVIENPSLFKFVLLNINAIIAAIRSINPLAASNLKNHLKGDDKYLSIIYFIKSSKKSLIFSNDWYKLSSIILILGNIDVKGSLKVSNTRINATNDIIKVKKSLK